MKPRLLLLLLPLLVAASGPLPPDARPLDQALKQARAQQALADAETARLQEAASRARGEAERFGAEQAAAAAAIEAAEARITAADMQSRLAYAYVAAHQAELDEEQRPISSLLAGLAVMAQRPPLLALADGGGADDLVKVGVLLDSTLPVIRRRTRTLSLQLSQGEKLETAARDARKDLEHSRQELASRRQEFAGLAQRALERSLATGGKALSEGDVSIAAAEQIEQLQEQETGTRNARQLASLLASEQPSPPRPFAPAGPNPSLPFAYQLALNAPAIEGLGAVNGSGVRSRGTSFASARGAQVSAPADGIVRFSGPFRDYDGILIIDHGGGWMSLIVNLSSPLKAGDKVRLGGPLGRALGPVEVELSHNGQRFSPAIIAGSSQTLSNGTKGG
ncbi:MAG TPA: peptidoglycan DD-metalloendopeptidase family protein [Sphingomicrobium sp.]|nr:peptidoglycan DD-metalloendopeptidase family protein [Sphingomicrobium sp.]